MAAPTPLSTINKIIATLYNKRISDFFPTYLTPRGTAMITAARNENTKNQKRNSISSTPRKTGINARNGRVVIKQRQRASVFP